MLFQQQSDAQTKVNLRIAKAAMRVHRFYKPNNKNQSSESSPSTYS